MYISDIQWFDYHQGIYEINNKKETRFSDSPRRSISFEQYIRSPLSHSIENEIKNMLLTTFIINEEFYHLTRSQNDDDNEIQEEERKINVKMSVRVSDPFLKTNEFQHYSSSGFNEYLNNTFLYSGDVNFFEENKNFNENIEENEKKEFCMMQIKKSLFHYKGITEKIEQHLKDKKNFIFGEILAIFSDYFCKKYGKILSKNNNLDKIMKKKLIEKIDFAFNELKDFIRAFQISINLFYKLHEYRKVLKYFLFSKENLQNFLTSIIFDDKIYNIVFEAQHFIDQELENELIEKLEMIKESQPDYFEVPDKYCLNEKTLKYFSEKGNANSPKNNVLNTQVLTESIAQESEFQTRKTTLSQNKFCLELKESLTLKSDKKDNFEDDTYKINEKTFNPFKKAIKNLRKIEKLKSPLHKLKNMRITAELIEQEIKEFYNKYQIEFRGNIGGEDFLPIHIYIISKANMPSLFTQCAIIDKFLSSNVTSSISGYYLVTMQVCLKYILSLNENELLNK